MKEEVRQAVAELKELNKKVAGILALNEKTGLELSRKLDDILGIMPKSESNIVKVLNLMALIAGALSILGIVDIIRSWLIL